MQFAVPAPAFCLQLATATHVACQVVAVAQCCVAATDVVPVSWQVPVAQFCVQLAPAPHVSWQLLFPLQLSVQLEPVQLP